MIRKTVILLLIIASHVLGSEGLMAENAKAFTEKILIPTQQVTDSLKWSIAFLNKLIYSRGEWYFTDNAFRKPVRGILNYAENDPLDTIVIDMRKLMKDEKVVYLLDRRPQEIRNTKSIKGYLSKEEIDKGAENTRMSVVDSVNISRIIVPSALLEVELAKAPHVPDGTPHELLGRKQKDLPPEFAANLDYRFNSMQFSPDMTGAAIDTARYQLFVAYRKQYNDSVQASWHERITFAYRSKYLLEQADLKVNAYRKAADEKNLVLLNLYNDKIVSKINDSLKIALQYLIVHAEADSALIRLSNLTGEKTEFWTANRDRKPIRMFLKNAQNDSLGVVLINNGKGDLKLVIDDGVKLTRFAESQNKTITFQTKAPDKRLQKINLKKVVLPPWSLIGNGSVSFTQTSLSNYWAKGGESSIALLLMSKYNANYSKDKIKWENSGEIRYGVSKTKTRGIEKNEDLIEIQSRFGYSAFKNWFYSAETNFRTQVARGYKYPDKVNPISAFLAPAYLTMSIGMDYKPSKNFSLFLSPFTSKTTYVNDTALIIPSRYGLEPGTRKHWEPGIIVKATWHKELTENISYDTRGEFFNNYKYTFQKYAVQWDQTLIMRVNRQINARVMTQLIYDYNTKFPILNDAGKVIARQSKWQFKELFTIGLGYKF